MRRVVIFDLLNLSQQPSHFKLINFFPKSPFLNIRDNICFMRCSSCIPSLGRETKSWILKLFFRLAI